MSAEKLFHAVVMVGIGAAAGCGGRSTEASPGGIGGAGPVEPLVSLAGFAGAVEPPGAFWPDACEYRFQYVCDSYSPLQGCRCDPSKPRGPEDCGGLTRTACSRKLCAPYEECYRVPDSSIDCECVPDAADSPADCDEPGRFECEVWSPEFRNCRCNPERPGTLDDCAKPEDFRCGYLQDGVYAACACTDGVRPEDCASHCRSTCQSEMPRFGCECDCRTIV